MQDRYIKIRKALKRGVIWQHQPSKKLQVSFGRVAADFWGATVHCGWYCLSSHGWNFLSKSKIRDEKLWAFQSGRAESIKIVSFCIYRLWRDLSFFFFFSYCFTSPLPSVAWVPLLRTFSKEKVTFHHLPLPGHGWGHQRDSVAAWFKENLKSCCVSLTSPGTATERFVGLPKEAVRIAQRPQAWPLGGWEKPELGLSQTLMDVCNDVVFTGRVLPIPRHLCRQKPKEALICKNHIFVVVSMARGGVNRGATSGGELGAACQKHIFHWPGSKLPCITQSKLANPHFHRPLNLVVPHFRCPVWKCWAYPVTPEVRVSSAILR